MTREVKVKRPFSWKRVGILTSARTRLRREVFTTQEWELYWWL